MKKLGVIILIALVGLCSCKKGNNSWHHLMRPANQATKLNKDKKRISDTPNLTPKVLFKEELADSAEFKCYHVKLQLPEDTMCYLIFNRVGLPGVIGIEEIPYAKVDADFFMHNDTVNKYNSVIWVYKNGFPYSSAQH